MTATIDTQDLAQRLVDRWRRLLDLRPELVITAKVDALPPGKRGATMHNEARTEFIVLVDPSLFEGVEPGPQHVIVHELVHVWGISEAGTDEEDLYEATVDQLAYAIEQIHEETRR